MSKRKYYRLIWLIVLLLGLVVPAPQTSAQGISDLLSLTVTAGYDGRFRANQWMPLRIEVDNQGNPIVGRVVVRPETSGNAVPNTFSTPVDLPNNASQTIFLYITARSNASLLRVELLDDDGQVVTSREVTVRDLLPRDRLYVVVTQASSGSVDLSGINVGGYEAYQANWSTAQVPDKAAALDAVDLLLFSDVDSGTLTPAQQEAIRRWVANGGHLVVTGGAAWQPTAAGLVDLLPLVPEDSETANDLNALVRLSGDYETELEGDFIIALGQLSEDAQVLARAGDDAPLVARRYLGNGVVDYMTVDPNTQPLRGWRGLPGLWFTLATSTEARPGWSYGFANWERAFDAVEILPGLDLLPAVLGLMAFLGAYIVLIGPLNYLILNRLNRREYAWVTIPVLILVFSALAWSVGFELRGSRATLSRLSVVQTWPDAEEGRLDQLIGLLAPRRGNYTLSMTDERLLRPISAQSSSGSVLGGYVEGSTEVRQTNLFEAVEFPVDASFIAAFSATGTTPRPDISGRMSLIYDGATDSLQSLRGSIRNDSDLTLENPVILARGVALRLNEPLEPGAVHTINANELILPGIGPAAPSPLEYAAGDPDPFLGGSTFYRSGYRGGISAYRGAAFRSAVDILGEEGYTPSRPGVSLSDDAETQETRRRQAFLDSFMIDQFVSTGRGNRVYLAGWTNSAPTIEDVAGAGYDVVDTTLYIVELEVERDISPADTVHITSDQFLWVSLERVNAQDFGPNEIMLYNESELAFRFTPLPDARLSEVESLVLIVDRPRRNILEQDVLWLWNWQEEAWEGEGEWEAVELDDETDGRVGLSIRNAERFIGPLNAVQVRALRQDSLGSVFIEQLAIEQYGQF